MTWYVCVTLLEGVTPMQETSAWWGTPWAAEQDRRQRLRDGKDAVIFLATRMTP